MDVSLTRRLATPGLGRYYGSIAALVASIGLVLLAVVDMRRAFLLPASEYFKVGKPSAILYFDSIHIPLLAVGLLGACLSYLLMARQERGLRERGADLRVLARVMGVTLLAVLVVDLFIYRGVPASRTVASGKIGVGQAIPLELLGGTLGAWLHPLREGINYMALVWHATLVGMLIGALFLTVVAPLLVPWVGRAGFRSHLAGSFLALGNPFCSCCAAPVGVSLHRRGAALGPTLAFVVSAPLLNVTSLILAASLLPLNFALLRIVGGLVVGILITYLVAVIASRWSRQAAPAAAPSAAVRLSSRIVDGFNRWFRFEALVPSGAADSPASLIAAWLGTTWRLARVAVPVLFVGAVVTAALVMALPDPTDTPLGIVMAAAFGTLLMVPTWTEMPMALGFLGKGLEGPAAALLLTLPAVSVPALVIVGAATANYRAALLLGLLVFGVGVLSGIAFSLL
ncbi:MAG: permease [Chloroflexi bacterium]|nr:permease [Chloroflexota bacterium]